MKIIDGARRIAAGEQDRLLLGDITVARDWGHAAEYVEAMWRMLQQDQPDDFVIATGEMRTVQEFCDLAFRAMGIELRWEGNGAQARATSAGQTLVSVDPELFRPSDIHESVGNPKKASRLLGFEAKTHFDQLVSRLVSESHSGVST